MEGTSGESSMDNGEVRSFPWIDEWDDDVRRIVRREQAGMEDRVTATVIANVNQTINLRMDQQREAIAKVDAGQLYIIRRLDEQDGETSNVATTLTKLTSQVDRIEGRQLGIDQTEGKYETKAQKDRDRLISVARIGAGGAGTIGTLTLLGKWISSHWHGWWH
jgi:hypothetical protein